MRSIAKALLLMSVALPAGADTALVVGSVDEAATSSYGAPRYLGTGFAPLDHAGFDLLTAIDADAAALRGLVSRLVSAEEEERLLIALSGRFVHFDGWTWFLGRDAGEVDLGTVPGAGLPVQLLMDYAAASPARTVILLAPEDQGVPLGAGLTGGIGAMEVPEGLTVATGHPASVARFLRSDLLQPGRSIRDAFARAPGLSVLAIHDPGAPFVPAPVQTPQVPPAEQSYWEAMATLDNPFAYRAYLNRYPNGFYAAEARARIAAVAPPEPELTPQELEQALDLSRSQKRDIQSDLAVLGFYDAGIDGIFGRGTRGGIEAWQRVNGLAVTGYVDAAQITRLGDQADVRREELRAQDRAYWTQTGQGQDEAGLRAYLDRYPGGEYSELARQRLAEIEAEQESRADRAYWNQIGRGQDEAGLRAYLDRYPNGEFSQLARQRLNSLLAQRESEAWRLAQSRDSIQGYRVYLNDYPNGPNAGAARQRLAQLQQAAGEPAAWQQAQGADTVAGYRRYLNEYPGGPNAEEARRRIRAIEVDDRAWQQAQSRDTIPAYRDYLNRFSTPRHRQAALDRIDAIQSDNEAWQQAQAADTVQGYRRYLQAFPNGRHAAEARQRLNDLQGNGGGSTGSIPLDLQLVMRPLTRLGLLGPDPTAEDVREALRVFQRNNNLPVTGTPDRATTALLAIGGILGGN
ncbi:MAG: peptidoglycan-binding protein [Nioella sp.]